MLPEPTRILVTDAEARSALAVVRSLGRQGHIVHVCSPLREAISGQSRFVHQAHVVPDPRVAPEAYAAAVAAVAAGAAVDFVLPISDPSCSAILPRRHLFGCVVLGPTAETFFKVSDKPWLLDAARAFGLNTPPQVMLRQHPDGASASTLSFPVVLKPHRSVAGGMAHIVAHAARLEDLCRVATEFPDEAYPLLVQQRVTGPGRGIFILRVKGRVIARFAHQRLIEFPPSGGHSVQAESVAMDTLLSSRVEDLLASLDWEGPAMAEFKVDSATGVPYLMEVNGRFWGSLQLAIDAGVDFPALWIKAAAGAPLEGEVVYRTGVRTRTFWGLIEHLLVRMRHSGANLSLPADAPSRVQVLAALLPLTNNGRYDTLRLGDFRPFLYESYAWIWRRITRMAETLFGIQGRSFRSTRNARSTPVDRM